MPFAGSVSTVGRALAVVALSSRPSRVRRNAVSGGRRAIASMLPPRGPWRLEPLTQTFPEGCGFLLEPLLAHLGGGVDAHLLEAGVARVHELVRRVRRDDQHVTRLSHDRLAAGGEGGGAGLQDEGLLVGMRVEPRPLAGRVRTDEERASGAVVPALEAAGALAAGEVAEGERVGHRGPGAARGRPRRVARAS